jgi:hypothetical protein
LGKIFPEKKLRGLSPNFYNHISVSDLYFPTIGLPFGCCKIGGPILMYEYGIGNKAWRNLIAGNI